MASLRCVATLGAGIYEGSHLYFDSWFPNSFARPLSSVRSSLTLLGDASDATRVVLCDLFVATSQRSPDRLVLRDLVVEGFVKDNLCSDSTEIVFERCTFRFRAGSPHGSLRERMFACRAGGLVSFLGCSFDVTQGCIMFEGDASFERCSFRGISAHTEGGTICLGEHSRVTVDECSMKFIHVGILARECAQVELRTCTIRHCEYAIVAIGDPGNDASVGAKFVLRDCDLRHNMQAVLPIGDFNTEPFQMHNTTL